MAGIEDYREDMELPTGYVRQWPWRGWGVDAQAQRNVAATQVEPEAEQLGLFTAQEHAEREAAAIAALEADLAEPVWPDTAEAVPLEGRKDDTGKDPWRLFPWDAARAIVKVLGFGATKYSERNWEKGMDWSRPFDACIRHLTAWWEGEKADPETGMSHLWHAGCCIVFLISYEIRGIGRDNRPR